MSKKICKGHPEWEDVAHYAIEQFILHERGQELVDAGRGMQFLSGIIWRSFHSATSEYYTVYKQKGRVHSADMSQLDVADDEYDMNQDLVVGAIQGILEDMQADKDSLWYRARLFLMWLQEPNYSDIARRTGIPRNSVSQAVEEAKVYIRSELKRQNIHYDL